MAVMYPRELARRRRRERRREEGLRGAARRARRRVGGLPLGELDCPRPGEGARDGEIDFVLCHPDKGILCLEVKGGGIECRHGEWFRTARRQAASASRTRSSRRSTTATRSGASSHGRWIRAQGSLHRPRRRLPRHHGPPAGARARRAARDPDRPQRPQATSRRRSSACSPSTAARARSASRPARAGAEMLRDLLAPRVGSRSRWPRSSSTRKRR